jgi:2-C-methyl-D-erythritol 4-phosphate cytidylyltransferase
LKTAALIVAAGRGTRLGADIPKQYIPLNGPCALRRSVDLFLGVRNLTCVQVVTRDADAALYASAVSDLKDHRLRPPVTGGEMRASSVLAGLTALAADRPDIVLIHDAARPFMPKDVIEAVIDALETSDAACAALPVVDALWQAENGFAQRSVPREGLWRAQTPQGFAFDKILAAHRQHDGTGADDVAVARDAGIDVCFVHGSEAGYKITTAADLERALRDTRAAT